MEKVAIVGCGAHMGLGYGCPGEKNWGKGKFQVQRIMRNS
jgi:hypothetical protein